MAMRLGICFIAWSLLLADGRQACPVTKAPDSPFVPPAPYPAGPRRGGDWFLYGTPALWTGVYPDAWRVHGTGGSKMPYFRQGFDARVESHPDLTIMATRLDSPASVFRETLVSAANMNGPLSGTPEGMAIVTSVDIPTAGFWEIAAHYLPKTGKAETLTYTVWVEP